LRKIIAFQPGFSSDLLNEPFIRILFQKIEAPDPDIACEGIELIIQVLRTEWQSRLRPYVTWEWLLTVWHSGPEVVQVSLCRLGFLCAYLSGTIDDALAHGFVASAAALFANGQFDTKIVIADQFCLGLAVGGGELAIHLANPAVLEVLSELISVADEKCLRPVLELCARILALQAAGAALDLGALDIEELGAVVAGGFASAEVTGIAEEIARLIEQLAPA
jgi:hypothetical protein